MALFNSGNPSLTEKIYNKSLLDKSNTDVMTVRGSIQKFGMLLLLVFAAAGYTWKLYFAGAVPTMMTWFWVGLIGGLVCVIAISFKPSLSKYLAPAYALLEGLVLGGLSAIINDQFKAKYPNIVLQAVVLTFGVAFGMFLLYNFRIIRPTAKFKAIMYSSIMGIAIFYLVWVVLGFFGVQMSFMNWGDNSALGIGINLFVVAIASFSLIMNFEQIEVGQQMGAPRYMEWYSAFGLLVTLVWLYIEILKLLSRFSSNRN
jgi:uncharacterized YccA/Bax inhibitor family protein